MTPDACFFDAVTQ